MVDVRGFNGGLNMDSGKELLPSGDYTYAYNVVNGPDGIVNLPGNTLLDGAPPPPLGIEWICGSFFDKTRQRIIYFTHNNKGYHRIISVNVTDNTHTVLFQDNPFSTQIVSVTQNRVMTFFTGSNTVNISGTDLNLSIGDVVEFTNTTLFQGPGNNDGIYTVVDFNYNVFSSINIVQLGGGGTIFAGTGGTITYRTTVDVELGAFNWELYDTFNPNGLIKDIKVIHREYEGDLYYFIDPNKKLSKFNYDTLLNWTNTGVVVIDDYFNVIKAPPDSPISCEYQDEPGGSVESNNLLKKLFQFKYRFVYDDNEKSVWSAISKVPIPNRADDDEFNLNSNRNNIINLLLFTGDINVSKIEIAARVNIESEWSDFFLIETLDKERDNINDSIEYNYKFKNNGIYLPIDIQESNLLFDYVPDESNALELANGNTLVVGGIKDGYNRDTILDVFVDGSTLQRGDVIETGSLQFPIKTPNGSSDFVAPVDINPDFSNPQINVPVASIPITGNQVAGDVISIKVSGYYINRGIDASGGFIFGRVNFNETFTVTVSSGMSKAGIIGAFVQKPAFGGATAGGAQTFFFSNSGPNPSIDVLYVGIYRSNNNVNRFYKFESIDVIYTPAKTFSGQESVSCYKWRGRYKFGIVYYDENGKTNGVFTPSDGSWDATIGKYRTSSGIPVPYVVYLGINHTAPSWAKYYHLVRTKELTCDFSLIVAAESVAQDTSYMYFNITCLVRHATDFPTSSTIINYGDTSFVKGDRIRILGIGTDFEINNYEFEIIGLVQYSGSGKWIKVKRSGSFTLNTTPPFNYIIEIFRPSKTMEDEDLFFYEIGERYDILNINGVKYHKGSYQDQNDTGDLALHLLNDGDYYLRGRTQVINNSNGNTLFFRVQDRNFSDNYLSAVWSQGRPLVVDENIKEEYYPSMLRFSQSYIYGTNINNVSRFYPNNFEEADASFGPILRLKTRENFIRMFQRYKVGMIPIYRQIIIDNAASSQVALSERLLNKPNYYSGEYGIDKYGSSLVSTDYGDYFVDTINKAIVRVSLDGITNISDTYNLSSWANDSIKEDSYGYGCFNYENRNVIMLVGRVIDVEGIPTPQIQNEIIAYNEPRKKFESFYGYSRAQSILFVNGLVYTLWANITATDNFGYHVYRHDGDIRNNFFGEQQQSEIETVFNGNVQLKKTYVAIEELANGLWTGGISTGPLVNYYTTIESNDFTKSYLNFSTNRKENKFNATIKRNMLFDGKIELITKYTGEPLKGLWAEVLLSNSSTTEQRLISVSLKYIPSPLTNT
jgi:hypothetical protein